MKVTPTSLQFESHFLHDQLTDAESNLRKFHTYFKDFAHQIAHPNSQVEELFTLDLKRNLSLTFFSSWMTHS